MVAAKVDMDDVNTLFVCLVVVPENVACEAGTKWLVCLVVAPEKVAREAGRPLDVWAFSMAENVDNEAERETFWRLWGLNSSNRLI